MDAEVNQQELLPASTTASGMNTGNAKKCPYCPSEFRKADHFQRHVRSHTKEKPFRCHVCRKSYPRHDTLLRHARIHKQSSDAATPPQKGASSDAPGTTCPEDSPMSNSATNPRPVDLTGPVSGEQLTPSSHSRTASLAQGYEPEVQNGEGILSLTFSPDSSRHSMTAMHSPHTGSYGTTNVNQLQVNMLRSPPFANTDSNLAFPNDCFSAHDTLGASVFEDLSGGCSDHWLLEDDFDFTVFEHLGFSANLHEPHAVRNEDIPEPLSHPSSGRLRQRPAVPDLRRIWYIQIPDDALEAGSGTLTPANRPTGSLNDIDEAFRDKLVNVLKPSMRDEPLPSIEFLNLCIHLFFTRFNVALPLIHSPTFRPSHKNALLVLSICSAGCLSLGSEMAARSGAMLFERVNKAILGAPWEKTLPRTSDGTWDTTKAAMIGQTYALTSGDPAHRATAAAYHGSLIAIARHHRLLSPAPAFKLAKGLSAKQLDKVWRTWVRQEELRRVAVLLYIHDAEIASLFHHEPVFRHSAAYIPTVCSHELFSAPSAAIWASLFRAEQRETNAYASAATPDIPEHSSGAPIGGRSQPMTAFQKARSYQTMFNVYNGISAIAASICECRYLGQLSFMMVSKFETDLLTWYASTPRTFQVPNDHSKQAGSPFSLLPFWHYTFITLCTNLNLLELAVGREGTEAALSAREYVLSWIASPDSKRCLLHALFLQNLIVSTKIGAVLAFNTPRILYSAALCWHCYMLYTPESNLALGSRGPPSLDGMLEPLKSLPEIQLLQEVTRPESANFYPIPDILDETLAALPKILAAKPAEMKAETLCVIECILRRLGTGGISVRFADIIQVFISGANEKASHNESLYG